MQVPILRMGMFRSSGANGNILTEKFIDSMVIFRLLPEISDNLGTRQITKLIKYALI